MDPAPAILGSTRLVSVHLPPGSFITGGEGGGAQTKNLAVDSNVTHSVTEAGPLTSPGYFLIRETGTSFLQGCCES